MKGISSVTPRQSKRWATWFEHTAKLPSSGGSGSYPNSACMSGLARAYAPRKAPCSALIRGPQIPSPSAPATKVNGSPSSPCTSTKTSTPVASIAASAWSTSGDRASVGASYSPVVHHSRLRLAPHALVRRWPRTAPSGFIFGTMWNVNCESSRRARPSTAPPGCRSAEQAVQQALGVEGGLALARVLAVDHPAVQRAAADLDDVELAAVERLAERAHRGARRRAVGDERELALVRVEVKVGEDHGRRRAVVKVPAERALRRVIRRRLDALPRPHVGRVAHLRARPRVGVRGVAGVDDRVLDGLGDGGADDGAEGEPLEVVLLLELGVGIRFDLELDVVAE